MSQYYNCRRTKNCFDPKSREPFKLSRSKIDRFLECPFCFYMDRRLGVDRPPGFPFNLNSAVDTLLKKEFDIHRDGQTPHPLMEAYGLKAVPFSHPDMEKWRDAFTGVQYLHPATNFLVFGGVDDIWKSEDGKIIVVDYKATSKDDEVNLDADWQDGYKRQMEVYQWLLRKNNFDVSDTGYFVYANGKRDRKAFDGKLEFDVKIISYKGDDSWVDDALIRAHECLMANNPPEPSSKCDYCNYRRAARDVQLEFTKLTKPKALKK